MVGVLKKRHSLKGVNLLPLIRRVMDFHGDVPEDCMRMQPAMPTEELTQHDLESEIFQLTGEMAPDILKIVSRERNMTNLRLLLHLAIIYANEEGFPKGQELRAPAGVQATSDQPPAKKQKSECGPAEDALERRIKDLEERSKATTRDAVQAAKDKVRTLALQTNPSQPLLLLAIEELSRLASKTNHEDADIFEELSRQADKHQHKLDIAALCLKVLSGRATDTITKALSKCLKEKQMDTQLEERAPKAKPEIAVPAHPPTPPMWFPPGFAPYHVPGNYMFPGNMFPPGAAPPRPPRVDNRAWPRPRGACHFCESPNHFVRDCEKMKQAKKN